VTASDAAASASTAAVPHDRRFVDQILDYAIIALNPDGNIRSWNAGAQRLHGYPAEDAVGRDFSIFYPEDDLAADVPRTLLDRARADGRVEHTGWRMRQDGSRFWGDVAITALRDDLGAVTGFAKVTRDLTDRHQLETALRDSESRFRLLVAQVLDYAIIALDPDGVIQSWNAGAQRLKGYAADEAIGRHFSIFYPERDAAAGLPMDLLARARSDGRVEHSGWRVRQDGSRFWGHVVITALRDDLGAVTGYAKVTRDLTDQHRVEQARKSLFATVSHDLRSPIMAIGSYAALIADAELEVRRQYAERITDHAVQLEYLVNTLFDYTKLSDGRMQIVSEPVPVSAFLERRVDNLRHLLGEREVSVAASPVIASADAPALTRVFDNVLTNAIKYSPDGSPIEIYVDSLDASSSVRIRVVDHGRGIDPEDLPIIFDEFVRGRLATDDGGTGLGLAAVRRLVELQGGRVEIASVLGVGTAVVVELPQWDESSAK
jgi:PAS domain S-box-containing protein